MNRSMFVDEVFYDVVCENNDIQGCVICLVFERNSEIVEEQFLRSRQFSIVIIINIINNNKQELSNIHPTSSALSREMI